MFVLLFLLSFITDAHAEYIGKYSTERNLCHTEYFEFSKGIVTVKARNDSPTSVMSVYNEYTSCLDLYAIDYTKVGQMCILDASLDMSIMKLKFQIGGDTNVFIVSKC